MFQLESMEIIYFYLQFMTKQKNKAIKFCKYQDSKFYLKFLYNFLFRNV